MPIHRRALFALALSLTGFAPVQSNAHEIKFGHLTIIHPWCRQTPGGIFGFMKITNNGTEDDRLVTVTAEISDHVELSDAGGIPVPAGKTIKIAPDAFRVSFLNARSKPVPNTEIKGTLTFAKAGTLQIDFEVEEPE
jgi:periplasmic copper chaperone A